MNKKLAISAIFLVIMGGTSIYQANNIKKPSGLTKVTVSQAFEVFLYAPLYIAQDKGFFKDEGLEVKITTAGGDEKAFAALLSNNAQFAIGDPTFVAVAGEKGQPGQVVASVLAGAPFWGVAKNKNINLINEPADLTNYSVATFPAPSTAYALQTKMFKLANLKPNIKQITFGGLLPALEANQVDIALELEPNVSTAVKNGSHVVFALANYYPDFALTGLTVLPQYSQQNPATVQGFVNALKKAGDYIRSNPDDAAKIMSKRFSNVDEATAVNALNNIVQVGVIPKSMVVSKSGWNTATQLRLDTGDIKTAASYESYVDVTFGQKADLIK